MKLQQRLGIDLPLIQAPMAGAQGSALTIAVSNEGALGSLPCAMLDVEGIRKELATIRANTSKPYNLNFFCHSQPEADEARESRWHATLAPYFAEFGIDPSTIRPGPGRKAFGPEHAEVIEEFRPPIVSFHFGLPAASLVSRVKHTGAMVMASATTVDEALWLQAHGADVIIAQGVEAGGHRGLFLTEDIATQVGTFALLPQVRKAVTVPVVAAGGIADAQGVAAAMALGAAGVQVGTAYLLCPEVNITALHRAALQGDSAHITALTNLFTGRPARGIVNRLMRELGYMHSGAPRFPLATSAITPLRAKAESLGNSDFSPLWAGQNTTGCKAIPAGLLTRELALGLPASK